MADAIPAFGEAPVNVQMRAGDAAGAALEAAFVVDADMVAFQAVDVRRAQVETRLAFAFFHANFAFYDF